jgi:hypothetical protein
MTAINAHHSALQRNKKSAQSMVAIFQELPGIDRPGAIAAHAMYVPIVFSQGWETPRGSHD